MVPDLAAEDYDEILEFVTLDHVIGHVLDDEVAGRVLPVGVVLGVPELVSLIEDGSPGEALHLDEGVGPLVGNSKVMKRVDVDATKGLHVGGLLL